MEIHVRDNLQFELKTDYFINPQDKRNIYKQEVYLFIPNSLQINSFTYSKQQFYLDQTNLIRYKTPQMSLADLLNAHFIPSPLHRIEQCLKQPELLYDICSDELKLFGAIFHSTLREQVMGLIESFINNDEANKKSIDEKISLLCLETQQVCQKFRHLQQTAHLQIKNSQLIRQFKYIDEFISISINELLMILLKQFREIPNYKQNTEKEIAQLIHEEQLYRNSNQLGPKTFSGQVSSESILHRLGLLHRFVLEALTLKNYRFSVEEKHAHFLGAFAAGMAMLVYMILFVWRSSTFVINSFPFVALAVVLYILKDRLKEGLKTLYFKKIHRWFPDYSTVIKNSKKFKVGKLKENFSFIDAKSLPEGFLTIRNHHFHEELQALQRHEKIIQYKREVILYQHPHLIHDRRREMTILFRFNVHQFLQKLSNPLRTAFFLDPTTHEIKEQLLPKVYHLNLIIQNTSLHDSNNQKVEIKAFRVVIDKGGIKRVEQIKF